MNMKKADYRDDRDRRMLLLDLDLEGESREDFGFEVYELEECLGNATRDVRNLECDARLNPESRDRIRIYLSDAHHYYRDEEDTSEKTLVWENGYWVGDDERLEVYRAFMDALDLIYGGGEQ